MKSGTAVDFIEKWSGLGGESWVNTVKSPIWDEKGEVIGVIGILGTSPSDYGCRKSKSVRSK